MSHTNVYLENIYSSNAALRDEVDLLRFKNALLEKKVAMLQAELENIPEAILEYGYVDLSDDEGLDMRLIEKPKEKEAGK